jgi:phosphatidylinositol alpha-mannosyltransferase
MRERYFKILMASDFYYPHPGGVSEHIHHLTRELRNLGHDVYILTSRIKDKTFPFEDPHYVIRVGKGIKVPINKSFASITFSPLITKRVKEILENGNYDIVHVHGSLAPTLPLLTLFYSESLNFATFHAAHSESRGYELFKPILQKVFEKIDGCIAVSQVAKETISRHFPGEYRIIPNGVDVVRFSPTNPPISFLREEGYHNILFVGRFDPRKGLRYLLQAMPHIIRKNHRVRLIVVGGGPLKKWYEQFIKEEVRDKVHFVGVVPPDILPRYYTTADVFVAPATEGESFGIILLEAMASGIPIVASRIPGYSHVFEDGEEGFFCNPADPLDIADKVLILLENRELRMKMGKSGRAKVMAKYAWQKVAHQVEDFYREVWEKKRGRFFDEKVSGGWI